MSLPMNYFFNSVTLLFLTEINITIKRKITNLPIRRKIRSSNELVIFLIIFCFEKVLEILHLS